LETGKGRGKGPALAKVTEVNGLSPEAAAARPEFNKLTAIHPRERLTLETATTKGTPLSAIGRVIDLLCPFGKGQRALIVAPAKAGKTTVLQALAEGVRAHYPQGTLPTPLV